jgi:hypothetical protein
MLLRQGFREKAVPDVPVLWLLPLKHVHESR